jgi:hypothetical protein
MTKNPMHSKTTFITLCGTLAAGIEALPDATFLVGGKTLTKAQITLPLTTYVDQATKTAAAKTAYDESLIAERASEEEARAVVDDVKPYLAGRFGAASPQLQQQFGLPPHKKPQKTVAAKAGAIAKGKATRTLLGTRGSKQKKELITSSAQSHAAPPAASPAPTATPAEQPAAPPAPPTATKPGA